MKLIAIYAVLATITASAYVPHDAYDKMDVRVVIDGHYWTPILFSHDPDCPKCKKDKDLKDYAPSEITIEESFAEEYSR